MLGNLLVIALSMFATIALQLGAAKVISKMYELKQSKNANN